VFTNVSEVLTAFIIKATRLVATQKTAIFALAAARKSNPIKPSLDPSSPLTGTHHMINALRDDVFLHSLGLFLAMLKRDLK
jgi:hypothetical protein